MSQKIVSNIHIGNVDLVAPSGNYNHFGSSNVVNVNSEECPDSILELDELINHRVRQDGGHCNPEVRARGHNARDPDARLYREWKVRSNRREQGGQLELTGLHARIAAAAMHNSAARVEAPKCLPETRKAVQEDIFSWMSDRSRSHATQQILWLTGPAGAGGTAIMGTVSDKLEEKQQVAATFYFSSCKGAAETRSKRGFVATLAYQLVVHPALRDRISPPMLSAIRDNPAIFDMSLKRQLEVLVLEPLRASQDHPRSKTSPPMAILIDGVDECGESAYDDSGRSRKGDQIEVLSVLSQAIADPAFPFRVVVASRPETWIREFFASIAAINFMEIFLDDKYSQSDDIRLFLKSKFAELSRRYGYPPLTWPLPEDLEALVANASGQFIYAATVIRWVETPGKALTSATTGHFSQNRTK